MKLDDLLKGLRTCVNKELEDIGIKDNLPVLLKADSGLIIKIYFLN